MTIDDSLIKEEIEMINTVIENRQNINPPINPPNFMNLFESLAFMHNTNLEKQKEILDKLNKIEKMLKKIKKE